MLESARATEAALWVRRSGARWAATSARGRLVDAAAGADARAW